MNAVRNTLQPDDLPRLRIYARIFGTETVVNNRAAYLTARPHTHRGSRADQRDPRGRASRTRGRRTRVERAPTTTRSLLLARARQ